MKSFLSFKEYLTFICNRENISVKSSHMVRDDLYCVDEESDTPTVPVPVGIVETDSTNNEVKNV